MVTVCNPHLEAVQEGRQYHGSVDADFCDFLQVLVAPDMTVESAESTVCLCQSVIHLFVDFCV